MSEILLPPEDQNVERAGQTLRRRLIIGTVGVGAVLLSSYGVYTFLHERAASELSSNGITTESPTTVSKSPSNEVNNGDFANKPSWSQNFVSMPNGQLDGKLWTYQLGNGQTDADCQCEGWGNNEQQFYTQRPDNVRIENGQLILEARREDYGGYKYTSARINTKGKFDFQYGKLEVTAKLPVGLGTWPAIWLLSSDNTYTKNLPESTWKADPNTYARDGEIDIMEAVGNTPGVYSPDFHTYNTAKNGKSAISGINVPDATTTFHRYGLEWYPDKLVYTLDGKPVYTVQKPAGNPSGDDWPFTHQRFYLILNLALGGDWGGNQTSAAHPDGIDSSQLPARFEISGIDYYPLLKP